MARYRKYQGYVPPDPDGLCKLPSYSRALKISEYVDKLCLKAFDDHYRNDVQGRPAYPVRKLIKILLYASLDGEYSFRRISRYCIENSIYRILCNGDFPSYSTLSRFYSRFQKAVTKLFYQVVSDAKKQGFVSFKEIAGDGVRLKSCGSRSKIFDLNGAQKKLISMELKEKRGVKINKPLRDKIKKAIPLMRKRAKEKGKKQGESTSFVHLTEADARLIKKKERYLSGYNAQAVADGQMGIVLEAQLYSNSFDKYNGLPIVKRR